MIQLAKKIALTVTAFAVLLAPTGVTGAAPFIYTKFWPMIRLPQKITLAIAAFAALLAPTGVVPALHYADVIFVRSTSYVQAAAMALLLLAIHYVSTTGAAPFIYTRF